MIILLSYDEQVQAMTNQVSRGSFIGGSAARIIMGNDEAISYSTPDGKDEADTRTCPPTSSSNLA